MSRRDHRPSSPRGAALIPAVADWQSFRGAFLNLAVFGLAVVAGEWLVHQLEYLTEYGPRFGNVMAAAPHGHYMETLGIVLGAATVGLVALAAVMLLLNSRARSRLIRLLPPRVARHVPPPSFELGPNMVARTALVLAVCQAALYSVQENIEGLTITGQWRGLSVLLASQHATVIPFHVLIAACSALLLWTLSSCVRQSCRAVRVARVLVAAFAPRRTPLQTRRVTTGWIPDLRLTAGVASPRSPPIA
jgi:hypothetical protein